MAWSGRHVQARRSTVCLGLAGLAWRGVTRSRWVSQGKDNNSEKEDDRWERCLMRKKRKSEQSR